MVLGFRLRGEGREAALEAIGLAGVDGALLGGAVEGRVGVAEGGFEGLFVTVGGGFADAADGGAGEGAARAIAVAFAERLVPALDSGLMVSHSLRYPSLKLRVSNEKSSADGG